LAEGRVRDGETSENACFRQVEAIMAICNDAEPVDS